jgi:hypothetical protein
MKRCPECDYDNNDNDLRCEKCKHVFETVTKEKEEIEKTTEEWPSDEWKDWNLM